MKMERNKMKVHYLKTIQPYFEEIWMCRKTFELRKNDRGFEVGDVVVLMEYERAKNQYSGNQIIGVITYILDKYHDALNEPYVIFSFKETSRNYNTLNVTA